jgi:phage shock protein A
MLTKRMTRVWRAMVGARITELEACNAESMLDLEKDRLRRQVAKYNRGLAGHAAVCERLKSRIAQLEQQRDELRTKIESRLALDDRDGAGRCALRLEAAEGELEALAQQLAQGDATYTELEVSRESAVAAARRRIEALKRSIGDMKVQQALAELTEMAVAMDGQIGMDDGTLDRVRERVDEKRDYAAGRVRVARGALHDEDATARRAEYAVSARAALARFEEARDGGPADAPPSGVP